MDTPENLASQTREDIPLKSGKTTKWFYCNEDYLSGSKYINLAFVILTSIITIALLIQIYYGDYQIVPHGSVATDSLECSNIGTNILKQGGNAVDAVIASAFCLAVATPHVTSLDARGIMLIYNHRSRLPPQIIDFSEIGDSDTLPRLVLGLLNAHKQYGVLAWKKLLQPAVDLARNGCLIPKQLVQAITRAKAEGIFGNLEPGQLLIQEELAQTLSQIANFQKTDLASFASQINLPSVSEGKKLKFSGYNVFVPNNHSMASILPKTLHEIGEHNFTKRDILKSEYIYRLAQITQRNYQQQNLSSKYHEGTFSNIAVMDTQDHYVSLVSGMYRLLGSGDITSHGYIPDVNTDVIFSRFPMIITDGNTICGRRIVFGTNNIVLATQIIMELLVSEENAIESVESPRFHVLSNGTIGVEDSHLPAFDEGVLTYLKTLSSKVIHVLEPYQSINMVEKIQDNLKSHSDSRGGGIASRY